ncbi:hypothetical protein BC628DRAFT_1418494 [Trametes gibbosa]|nr:hypothetical protein BC628DRAFT_1418494 [Trametes gibbosa]
MAHRPKVPTALHSELIEYSSLLRALRTSSTLDLVQHLAEPPPATLHSSLDLDDVSLPDEDHQEGGEDPPLTESVSHGLTSEVGSPIQSHVSSQTRKQLPSGKTRGRDTWTRWPLLSGDVHVPEWSLQDEVLHTAQEAMVSLKMTVKAKAEASDGGPDPQHGTETASVLSDEEDGEISALPPVALRAMTADSAAFLARILALLAAHVPNAGKSMQNRLHPINWETVIDIACTHGVISPGMAESVRDRMTRIYAPSQPSSKYNHTSVPSLTNLSIAAQRVSGLSTLRSNLAHRLSELDSSLLDSPQHVSQEDSLKPEEAQHQDA